VLINPLTSLIGLSFNTNYFNAFKLFKFGILVILLFVPSNLFNTGKFAPELANQVISSNKVLSNQSD